jgi:diamine N-acetyltransferase
MNPVSILKASVDDHELLAEIGRESFIQSHGMSAPAAVVENYVEAKFNAKTIYEELSDPRNEFHIIYYEGQPAGYSKIIFNQGYEGLPSHDLTKLERFYLLREFYSRKLGDALLEFNLELSKHQLQKGMWLFVWVENLRAFKFYSKKGFEVVGQYDFFLSPTHANPNHQMLLMY